MQQHHVRVLGTDLIELVPDQVVVVEVETAGKGNLWPGWPTPAEARGSDALGAGFAVLASLLQPAAPSATKATKAIAPQRESGRISSRATYSTSPPGP